jgi:hypothetical protein
MGILEEAKSTLALLSKVKAVAEGANEARAIDQLRNELAQLSEPINQLACGALILRQGGVGLSTVPELKGVADTVRKAQERFAESPKATTLRQGTRWTALTNKLEKFAKDGATTQASDWQNFFENNYFVGPSPTQRGAKLAKTPENSKAIERYQTIYQAFNKYRSQPPKDSGDFNTLRSLSKQLAEITFQEDVPEEVRKFLDATSFGAGLDLLTPEVLNWLRENNLLTNFTVRAKAN